MINKTIYRYTAKATVRNKLYELKAPTYEALEQSIQGVVAQMSYSLSSVNSYQTDSIPYKEPYIKTLVFPGVKWEVERKVLKKV